MRHKKVADHKHMVIEVHTPILYIPSFLALVSTVDFVAGSCPGIFTQQLDNTTFNLCHLYTIIAVN